MRDRGEKRDTFGAEVRGEDLRAAALSVDACLLVGAALLLHVGGAGRSSLRRSSNSSSADPGRGVVGVLVGVRQRTGSVRVEASGGGRGSSNDCVLTLDRWAIGLWGGVSTANVGSRAGCHPFYCSACHRGPTTQSKLCAPDQGANPARFP